MAATVDVPNADITAGITGRTVTDDPLNGRSTLAIRSGKSDPGETHVKTSYKGRWFWIDNPDLKSKRALALLLILLTLTDRGQDTQAPLLTISG